MKTIVTTTNIYKVNELPKKVQNAIFDKWRAEGEYPYFDDYNDLLDNICECFKLQATIKQVNGYRYVSNIEFWDNKVLKMSNSEKFDYLNKCFDDFSYETEKSAPGIFNEEFDSYFGIYLDDTYLTNDTINLTGLFWSALSHITDMLNKDIDRYYSFDTFLDDCEQNDRYFTIDGDEYEE